MDARMMMMEITVINSSNVKPGLRDGETCGRRYAGTRRRGDAEIEANAARVTAPPGVRSSASLYIRILVSPRRRLTASPRLRVSVSPRLRVFTNPYTARH